MDISVDWARLCGRHQGARHPWRLRRDNRCLRRFWPRTRSKITKVNYPMQYRPWEALKDCNLEGMPTPKKQIVPPTDRGWLVMTGARSTTGDTIGYALGLGWVGFPQLQLQLAISLHVMMGRFLLCWAFAVAAGTPRRPIY